MFARNLLFLLAVAAGFGLVRSAVFPLSDPKHAIAFDPGPAAEPEFRAVVDRVNETFRTDWADRGLTPAPPAPDLAVARRLSLALTGTVPSLEEIRQFENAPPGTRLDGWVNHLLRDRRFGDYFAERLARAYVGTEDGPLILYRKRRFLAWLSDELLKNTSYADLVRQMIAADGLNTDTPAVNFVAAAFDDDKKQVDAERLTTRVSRAFLGLRIDCAQCHDHFLEPSWHQTDFQSLAAFFGQTKQVVTHVSDDSTREYRFEDRKNGGTLSAEPAVPFLPDLLPADGTRRQRLAAWVTHPQNRYFARATVNRVWAMLFNRPLLKRVEAQTLDEDAHPALDVLAADFAAHGHDLHRLIRLIAALEPYRFDSAADFELTPEHDRAWAAFPLTRLRPEQVIGSVLQAASVRTIDRNSHVVVRLVRYFQERDFVQRYGDDADDEFDNAAGTIPQRLLVLNGNLVNEKAKPELVNAAARVALMAPDDPAAVDAAYLSVLSRRPTDAEQAHFVSRIAGTRGEERSRRVGDLYWVLFNSTELSWNH